MSFLTSSCWLLIPLNVPLIACEGSLVGSEDSTKLAEARTPGETEALELGSSSSALSVGSTEEVPSQTADGETFSVLVPTASESIAVPPGGRCGIEAPDGTPIECEPGFVCRSTSEVAPAICVAIPRAPHFEG